jgi:hypothetical protein
VKSENRSNNRENGWEDGYCPNIKTDGDSTIDEEMILDRIGDVYNM